VQVWPDFAVAPALMVAGTDTKHYLGLCQNIFRFMPVVMKASHLNMRALPCKASAL
jgi:carboxypeptidase PM20D1